MVPASLVLLVHGNLPVRVTRFGVRGWSIKWISFDHKYSFRLHWEQLRKRFNSFKTSARALNAKLFECCPDKIKADKTPHNGWQRITQRMTTDYSLHSRLHIGLPMLYLGLSIGGREVHSVPDCSTSTEESLFWLYPPNGRVQSVRNRRG